MGHGKVLPLFTDANILASKARRNRALLVQRLYILGNVLLTYVLDILTFEHPGCIPDTANVLH